MDILNVLNTFKGKELDEAHIVFLTEAFDLQNRQIKQLKENISTLTESLDLIRDKEALATKKNEKLMYKIAQLEEQLAAISPGSSKNRLSEIEKAILSSCMNTGITGFCSEDMVISLPFNRLEITNAIDQLERKGILQLGPLAANGSYYSLTDHEQQYETEIEKGDYSF